MIPKKEIRILPKDGAGEYRVAWFVNKRRDEPSCYYTPDLEDAALTLMDMYKREKLAYGNTVKIGKSKLTQFALSQMSIS